MLRRLTVAAAALLCAFAAQAATNLAAICKDASPPIDTTACNALIYGVPAANDYVKGSGGYFAQWSLFPPDAPVVICTADVAQGSSACPTTVTGTASQVNKVPTPYLNLSWEQTMKAADGSVLTDLAGFRIVYGTSADALTQTIEVKNPATTSYTLSGLAFSTKYYVALKSFTEKAGKQAESDKSATAIGTTISKPDDPNAPPPKPVPPVLTVTSPNLTAYDLVKANDKLTAKAIGTVPADTKCLTTISALGLYGVPRLSVKLNAGLSRPQVVLATCI